MKAKKLQKKTILIMFLTFSNLFYAQELVKMYGSSNDDRITNIIPNSDGSYLLCGSSNGSNGFISDTPNGGTDMVILKVASDGTIIWQKNYGGTEYDGGSIYSSPDGGFICLGTTYSNNGDLTNNYGASDIWLFKINAQGDILWSNTFGGSGSDQANDMVINADGSFTIVGLTRSSNFLNNNNSGPEYKPFVLKVNSAGNTVLPGSSVYTINNNGGRFNSIKVSPDGGYWIAGNHYPENTDESQNIVVKMNSTGSIQLYTIIPPLDPNYNQNTLTYGAVLSDGSFIVSGEVVNLNTFQFKGTLCKIAPTGSIVWQKEYPNADFISVRRFELDTNGSIWAAGFGAVSFDALGKLAKIDPVNGNIVNIFTFGGLNDFSDTYGFNLSLTPDGKILICGDTNSNTGTFQGLLNYGEKEGFLLRFDPHTLGFDTTSINDLSISIYPNPATYVLNLKNDSNILIEKVTVIDALGKIVMEVTNGFETLSIDKLQQGLYIAQIKTKDLGVINKKFIKK